jgi:ribonuclease D
MAEIGSESFVIDPDQAWQRIKAFAELDPDRQRLAQGIAGWRERRAMSSDRPRGWILPDAALRDIVFQVPRSRSALERIRELPDGIRENSGAQLLELVSAAAVPEPPAPLPQRRRPDPEQVEQVTRLADLTRRVAGSLELAPEILATRRELEQFARGVHEGPLLRGWRRAVIGEELLKAI